VNNRFSRFIYYQHFRNPRVVIREVHDDIKPRLQNVFFPFVYLHSKQLPLTSLRLHFGDNSTKRKAISVICYCSKRFFFPSLSFWQEDRWREATRNDSSHAKPRRPRWCVSHLGPRGLQRSWPVFCSFFAQSYYRPLVMAVKTCSLPRARSSQAS
jgi:hypothetical protein